MAIKVLMLGLDYPNEPKYVLDGSINTVVKFYERFVGYLGYKSSEIQILIDMIGSVSLSSSSSSPSEVQVQEIMNAEQVLNILKKMVQESQQGDNLIFLFVGHSVKDDDKGVLIDLGIDQMGNPRGWITGTELEKVDENLPHGVSFYPMLDCCYSSAILKGLKQYRPPATFGENIRRIFLSVVDTDDVEASESLSYTWNGHTPTSPTV